MIYFEDNFPGWSTGVNFKKSVSLNGGVMASGSANIDFSGSTGAFKFPSGTISGNGAVTGLKENVISGQGATATLTAAQSGSTCLFDRAAGIIYTLPAPVVGLNFSFIVTTTITSNNAKVITDAGTTLLIGDIDLASSAPATTTFFGNGSTHIAVTQNGTTTGGIIGSMLTFTCVSSTVWNVAGAAQGSGTLATPFATS